VGRRHRRKPEDVPELRTAANRTVEEHPDGEWIVQQVTGSAATKDYRCPGCDQLIPPATPHVVAWPFDDPGGLEFRRHWHRACWAARDRRSPRRSR
jgi:hypothetical protein